MILRLLPGHVWITNSNKIGKIEFAFSEKWIILLVYMISKELQKWILTL